MSMGSATAMDLDCPVQVAFQWRSLCRSASVKSWTLGALKEWAKASGVSAKTTDAARRYMAARRMAIFDKPAGEWRWIKD